MQTADFVAELTGHSGDPGHQVTPDDELRALAAAQRIVDDLTRSVGRHTTSPVHAVFLVHAAEHAAHSAEYAQLAASDLAQRTLAHELPVGLLDVLQPLAKDPSDYICGRRRLPDAPRGVPAGRSTFKNTAELLQNCLRIDYFEARSRMESVAHLFPRTDADGSARAPLFARLAAELDNGTASARDVGSAAKRLQKLRPQIAAQPDPEALAAELEDKLARSVRQDDPRTTKQLMGSMEAELERRTPEPTEEIVNSRIGLFYRGQRSGTAEFLLRTRPDDAELLLSLCAQTDNPRTRAGDRAGLLKQSMPDAPPQPSHHPDGSLQPGQPPQQVQPPQPDQQVQPSTGHRASKQPPTQPRAVQRQSSCPAPSAPTPSMPAPSVSSVPSGPTPATPDHPAAFPDFLLEPDEQTGRPLHTPEELAALTLGDGIAESADPFATVNGTAAGSDGLTRPQRHLQGLLNLLKANGRPANGKKESGLPAPRVVIIAHLEDLESRAKATGTTAHGQRLTPALLRQALCQADVIPMVMNGKSQVLDLGRSERYFPDYMRQAILARDGGCIVPGCTVPPEHLEIHHLDAWENGGMTRLRDGTPSCSNHHHAFHTGQMKVVLNADGLPAVVLPRFMDPLQLPRRNGYWRSTPQLDTPTLF